MDAYKAQVDKGRVGLSPFTENEEGDSVDDLGRMLIWLMAPVAAESMKYGSTVMSDPR